MYHPPHVQEKKRKKNEPPTPCKIKFKKQVKRNIKFIQKFDSFTNKNLNFNLFFQYFFFFLIIFNNSANNVDLNYMTKLLYFHIHCNLLVRGLLALPWAAEAILNGY